MTSGYITIELVRREMQDRTPEDNTIDCDLFFSDEDILHAMDRTAADYNSMSPIGIDRVSGRCLPADTSVFLDGVCSKLYGIAKNKLSRNTIEWTAGGTTVNVEKSRMEAFSARQQELQQTFKEAAKERKMEINRNLVWGSY